MIPTVTAAVEGPLDEAVARRLIVACGGVPGVVHIKEGKGRLLKRLRGYNAAAEHGPWLVLIDLDDPTADPAERERAWLPDPSRGLCLGVPVTAVEAWLLADRERAARFLRVARSQAPADPEGVPRPKRTVVDVARRSSSAEVRRDLVPREGSGREVGPAYTSRMIEFAAGPWRPDVAKVDSASLRRCMDRLERTLMTFR